MNKLLIIDDDEDVSAMLFILLRSKDFEVAVVTKSEDIFSRIKTFQPDIILLDVFLTGYDGRVICKQLKFHPDSRHIPVIMVSGDDEVLQSAEQYGANDVIQKPFEAEMLLSKINNLIK
ncbi:MAG: response regulator transcription factor [Chitinophagaceae bacterium]|nr:response regulator transcription factor [Chitinophagaceae bacterium]